MSSKLGLLAAVLLLGACTNPTDAIIVVKADTPSTCPQGTKAVSSILERGVAQADYAAAGGNLYQVADNKFSGYLVVTCSNGSGAVSKVTR